MTPKIMNSLKTELHKMAVQAENKKTRGELEGMFLHNSLMISSVLKFLPTLVILFIYFCKRYLVGWKCCRSGCNAEYTGPEKNAECCYYHPGAPVFHEGMKFWSCCERKTSDFTSFLNQVGCEKTERYLFICDTITRHSRINYVTS